MQFPPIYVRHVYFYTVFCLTKCLLPGIASNHLTKTISGLNSSSEVELILMHMLSLNAWLFIVVQRYVFSILDFENSLSQVAVLVYLVIIIWSKSKMFFISVRLSNKMHWNISIKVFFIFVIKLILLWRTDQHQDCRNTSKTIKHI